MLFETFEARLLLNGGPLNPQIGTVLASNSTPAIVQDADGTKLSVSLSGPGNWQVTEGAQGPQLSVTATTAATKVTLATSGGDGRFELTGIDIEGPAQSITGATTDLTGSFVSKGPLGSVTLGDVKDTTASVSGAVGTLSVKSWQSSGLAGNEFDGASITSFQSAGALNLSLNLSGQGATGMVLGTVSAQGALSGGLWHVAGRAGVISAGSVGQSWTGDFTGPVNEVITTGNFHGTLAAPSLQYLIVGGNLADARLYIGADLGADGKLGGTGANADTFGTGVLGHLRVSGSVTDSRVYVGVNPENGVYDDGDDVIVGGASSQVQELLIGGAMDAASRVEAGQSPATIRLQGATISPASDAQQFGSTTADIVSPTIEAALADDTGANASDGLTSDPTVAGKVTDAGGVATFRGGVDASPAAAFANLLPDVKPDGSFTLTRALITQLAGGSLPDGSHTLHLIAADKSGNIRTFDLSFIFDTTAPSVSASLADDTGVSATDRVTRDDAVSGQVKDANGVAALTGALDSGAPTGLVSLLQPDGSFTVTPALIAQLAGGSTADGPHTLHLIATDKAGNTNSVDLSFTLLTTPPAQPVFDLAPASDTGAAGDHITSDTPVTLTGTTSPNVTVSLVEANLTTTADASGAFQFANVALAPGANSFTAKATDAAGNASSYLLTITLTSATPDTTPPTLTAALAHDTGLSATDGITSNPTVSGTLVDNPGGGGVGTFVGGLDSTHTANFTNLIGNLNSNGAFTISAALVNTLAGGTLADGAHTLHLIASDKAGNSTSLDVSFTLQTKAPAIASFGLAQSSQTDPSDPTTTADGVVTLTGVADAGSTVTLGAATALAGAGGVFQFANVALAQGANTLTVTAANSAGVAGQSDSITVTRQGAATNDVATTWNNVTLNTIASLAMYPPDASRLLAIVSLAQYDALAAIEGTPAYMVKETVSGPVSEQAALAETAYEVLLDLFPALKANYDAALATSLQGIPTGQALTTGLALGKTVADAIVAIRQNDGSANFVEYDGGTQPGQWSPTAPNDQPAIDPQWGSVTPFAIASADALVQQIGSSPSLSSAEWAADLNQVESLGASNSTTRTADETQIALFWAGSTGTIGPAGIWNFIAQTVSQSQGLSLSANVRMFAVLNTALADAAIADWDVKYTNGTWRPIQAIAVASTVNSAAISNANWTPLLITPAFPEYASGHSTTSAAAATVLGSIFGDNTSFSFSVPYLAGVTRSFTSFSEAAQEAGMSRIYGGIHFLFSDTAGLKLGALVANQVLAKFALSQDTTPPVVTAHPTPAATNANVTLSGQIIDNLSGVKGATLSVDGGTTAPLTLDAEGNFSFTTTFALDGTADGGHSLAIAATDNAGNVATAFTRTFVLDTVAPKLTLTSLKDNDTLTSSSRLTGAATASGANIVALNYAVDGGVKTPISFDATSGAYDIALPVANLGIGQHTITLTTQDAAGNATTLTRAVSVTQLAAFTISTLTPMDGATDVGVTQRPRIDFSRAVNTTSLTASSFYATDSGGNVIATTVAPSQDGSYAFLLFTSPMPGSSTITLHVVGSLIRAKADGAFLDAAGTGATGGSTLTESFATVSTTGVAGTKIEGIVADPGPDLTPGTFDDVGRGPDGILNTADDIYKKPIAGVTVSILGTNLTAVTNSQGYFEIDNAPAGDVKLVLDGTTATNAPSGFYFPTMTLDLTIQPGVVNTPMSSMGTTAQMAANAGVLGTYLPRVKSSVLTTVSTTQPTIITTTTEASPSLSASQVGDLSLTIQPGSALDANGNPVTNFQVGIAAVPPQIVQDMLPAGVTQHSYDITIQAPGVAVFTAPATITFPNVFDAAPGTQLQVLSFDHTTGRLVIDGTATVSADGKTVTSDPGQGVTAPGWHGLAPPGGCGGSGGGASRADPGRSERNRYGS